MSVQSTNCHRLRSPAARGSTTLELVTLMAVIMVVAVVAIGTLGVTTRDQLGQLSFGTSPAADERHDDVDDSTAPTTSLLSSIHFSRPWSQWQWIGIAASTLNILLCLLLVRRSRRKSEPTEPEKQRSTDSESAIFERRQRLLRMLVANSSALVESRLEVRHVMTSDPVLVSPGTSIVEIRELMEKNQIQHLLVCDGDGSICGLVTERQLHTTAKTCRDLMCDVPEVSPDTALMQAITTLVQAQATCVAVTRNGIVQGILTLTDAVLLSQAMMQYLARISDQLKSALSEHRATTITAVASSYESRGSANHHAD